MYTRCANAIVRFIRNDAMSLWLWCRRRRRDRFFFRICTGFAKIGFGGWLLLDDRTGEGTKLPGDFGRID